MSRENPKIAILGFSLETNGFSPPSTQADIRSEHPRANGTLPGFGREMNGSGEWTMAPLVVAATSPGSPAKPTFFDEILAEVETGLWAALPVDGVYISEHSADRGF